MRAVLSDVKVSTPDGLPGRIILTMTSPPSTPAAPAAAAPPATTRPPVAARVIAVLFFGLGLNALAQVLDFLPKWGGEPVLLCLEQAVCAATGLAAGYGAWIGRPWAWKAALANAVSTVIMLASLGPLLDLDAAAQRGTLFGASGVFVLCAALAWYLTRALR